MFCCVVNDTIEQEVTSIDTGHSGGSSDSVTEETNDNNNVTSSYSFDAKQSGSVQTTVLHIKTVKIPSSTDLAHHESGSLISKYVGCE